ncbi:MAG: cell division protein ZapA [Limisphaerales bacterium]
MDSGTPEKKPVRVSIYNQTYALLASEEEGRVEELARTVDELMHSIAVQAGNIDSTRIAVLASLHLADQLRSLDQELASLRERIDRKAREFSVRLDGAIEPPSM